MEETAQREKKQRPMAIPKNSATFFRARAKKPGLFTFTATGDLQVPEMQGQAAKVIPLPVYRPAPPGESDAEVRRRDELVTAEREFVENLQNLKQAMQEWRETGSSAEFLKYHGELTRLDSLRSQLRSPLRWTHEYKRLEIREVLVEEFYQVKKLKYPVYGLQLRTRPFEEYTVVGEEQVERPIDLEAEAAAAEGPTETFVFFSDPKDPEFGQLSPETMVEFVYNSTKYNSLTQAYEVERITQLGRRKEFGPMLLKSRSPADILKISSRIVGNVENPRELWIQILTSLLSQYPIYATVLRKTENDTLVYANPKEGKWGIGLSETDPAAMERGLWKGPNTLGQAWQAIRAKLPAEPETEDEDDTGQSGGSYTEHGKTLEEARQQRANVLKGYYRKHKG
jgi:predicted NAD-dependent protein-ADP-ribosyltransferase YbiA (DUF1768 family)